MIPRRAKNVTVPNETRMMSVAPWCWAWSLASSDGLTCTMLAADIQSGWASWINPYATGSATTNDSAI
jgi:hypothetical protein